MIELLSILMCFTELWYYKQCYGCDHESTFSSSESSL